jgi:hypothetical protein
MDQFTQALTFFISALNQTFNPILGFIFLNFTTSDEFVYDLLGFLVGH